MEPHTWLHLLHIGCALDCACPFLCWWTLLCDINGNMTTILHSIERIPSLENNITKNIRKYIVFFIFRIKKSHEMVAFLSQTSFHFNGIYSMPFAIDKCAANWWKIRWCAYVWKVNYVNINRISFCLSSFVND